MERRHIKWLPLLLAGLFFAYQYFSSEKFVNPETERKSHVAVSTREEALLGLQSYQQVLAQSESIDSGQELEMINRVASRLASATVQSRCGQAVKKSGRTTGLSRNSIVGLNATIRVAYANECAGGAAFT